MLALTFGTEAEQARTIANIRAIHKRVNGTLREAVGPFPAGSRYSAEDPALLLWVYATVLESSVIAYHTLVGDVSKAERDAYCRDGAGVAIALGAHEADVPCDWTALERYISGMHQSGCLSVGADARDVATVLLRGKFSWFIGPVAWMNRVLTAGWLPAAIREQYGLPWTARDEQRFQWLLRTVRRVRRGLPRPIALWPEARRPR